MFALHETEEKRERQAEIGVKKDMNLKIIPNAVSVLEERCIAVYMKCT